MDLRQKSDTRPLLRNKVLYNRVINSIVSHELEECIGSKGNSQILSEVLTRMVYKSNGSAVRVTVMHDMIRRYTEKIIKDCETLKLDPTAEFEPPESIGMRNQAFVAFEQCLMCNGDIKPGDETKNFLFSQRNLEEIGQKIWGIKINPSCNAEKYKQLQNWAHQWYAKRRNEKNSSFNQVNGNDCSMPVLSPVKTYSRKCNESKISSSSMAKNSRAGSNLHKLKNHDIDKIESATNQIPEIKIADEPTDENKQETMKRELKTELIERHVKKRCLSKSIVARIDIPPSSKNQEKNLPTTNSTSTEDTVLMNKTLVEVIMLMKKRDLVTRKQDEEILRQLEDYLGSLNRSKNEPNTL